MDTPATKIKLSGKVLIEASAGTGKTWTLTAIIVRLLMEGKFRPQQIIATTFTRKAAAEMQRRINERLQNFREIFSFDAIKNPDDPLEIYLRTHYSREELQARCEISLMELNYLFIGTLDSLCQRWLMEYTLETGSPERFQLIDDNTLNDVITHDALRHFYCEMANENLELLSDQLVNSDIESVFDFSAKTQNALMDADLDPPPKLKEQIELPLPSLAEIDVWFKFVESLPINKNSTFFKRLDKIKAAFQNHNKDLILESLKDVFHDSKTLEPKNFLKKNTTAVQKQQFFAHPITITLQELQRYGDNKALNQQIFKAKSLWHAFSNVRDKIGSELDKCGKSSFLFNMKRLNQALRNSDLARYIQHRYPVLLVDESQDLNSEQTFLIEKIYLEKPSANSFLLLVGDPKQAIYRFRGGDVNNYNHLKKFFSADEIYPLLENRRSSQTLISALNMLYQYAKTPFLGENIAYSAMTGFDSKRKLTHRDGKEISEPFFCIQETTDSNQLINFVEFLLSEQSPYLYENHPIEPQNIMILAKSNEKLLEFARELRNRNIECVTHSDSSIFSSEIAADIRLLLQAFLHPFDRAKMNALLCSAFFQVPKNQLSTANNLQNQLQRALDSWRKFGLLAAIHEFMHTTQSWEKISIGVNKLENVIFLRALFEIIAKFAPHKQPEVFFDWWLEQLRIQPESDWAKAPPLPQQNAVSLLTVHKAKGLQAPIVLFYLTGHFSSNKLEMKRYYQNDRPHLTAMVDDPITEQLIQKEEFNEALRVIYVALTRAEDLLVTFFSSERTLKDGQPAAHLFQTQSFFKDWEVPQNLKITSSSNIHAINITAPPLLKTDFFGWNITSFTALSRGRADSPIASNRNENNHASFMAITDNIRQQFPRGAEAGSFLHELLERINPLQPNNWRYQIQNLIQRYQLEITDIQALEIWIKEILQTPLVSGLTLGSIRKRSNELSFEIVLSGDRLPLQKISSLFKRHGKTLNFAPDMRNYKFLRGEIDLIYQHENRFFLVDYKSNFLPAYERANLESVMFENQYFLQAAIYQLALYRRLRWRSDFDFSQLGAVEYLFLRGVNEKGDGVYSWDIPPEFIVEFDELLGMNAF